MLTMGLQKLFTQAAQERRRPQKVKGPNCTVVIIECVNWPVAKAKRQKLHAEDQEIGLWPVTSRPVFEPDLSPPTGRALHNKESVKLQNNPVKQWVKDKFHS